MMRVYGHDFCPFSAQVRLQIYAKGCPIAVASPPAGASPKTPSGRHPVLEEGGFTLDMSEVILQYIEQRFPLPSLLPSSLEEQAKCWQRIQFCNRFIEPLVAELLGVIRGEGSAQEVQSRLALQLGMLSLLLPEQKDGMTLDDCVLMPFLYYALELSRLLLLPLELSQWPELESWWLWGESNASFDRVKLELARGFYSYLESEGWSNETALLVLRQR